MQAARTNYNSNNISLKSIAPLPYIGGYLTYSYKLGLLLFWGQHVHVTWLHMIPIGVKPSQAFDENGYNVAVFNIIIFRRN